MPNPDVFLSYSHHDKERVGPLATAFEADGRSVWWDPKIPVGSAFRDVISAVLDVATSVVVIWSQTSISSPFVRDEATRGSRRGVLCPVRIDDVEPPLGFGEYQCADLIGW